MSGTISTPTRDPITKSSDNKTQTKCASSEIQTNYQLPTAVEALRAGWLATFQGAATVSALLGAIQTGLLVFFHDDVSFGAEHPSCRCNGPNWIPTTPQKLILILTYLSLVLSLAVTVTSYSLTAELSILPSRAAKVSLHTESQAPCLKGSNWDILRKYGLKRWTFYVWKFWCFSLIGAILCAVLSAAIFIGTREDDVIKGVVLVSVVLFVFPVLSLIWSISGE